VLTMNVRAARRRPHAASRAQRLICTHFTHARTDVSSAVCASASAAVLSRRCRRFCTRRSTWCPTPPRTPSSAGRRTG
jgi:hypothetical protein